MPTRQPVPDKLWWRPGVCLLLGILLFYNPFMTILSGPGFVHVRHPHSYRATVASSELRSCTLDPVKSLIPAPAVETAETLTQVAPVQAAESPAGGDFPRTVVQLVANSLWFRPPPAV